MTFRVGIAGCGVIGRRRAIVARDAGHRVVAVADLDLARANQVAAECEATATTDWQRVVTRTDLDAVVVSTVNKALAPVTIAALESGKHVLCEKPLGRNAVEAERMVAAARRSGRVLKTGFNHRHHPAIWKAHELCQGGALGSVMFIRAVYGHGGRPGYEKEWRANADLCGGGELLDQGVHVIDLCGWFMGRFASAFAATGTYYWELGSYPCADAAFSREVRPARLEDNAFALLRTADGRLAQFHTSWTQWKNRFTFEVYGRDGYLAVEGLGGSYGTERLRVGRRRPEGGAPDETVEEFEGPDRSGRLEWDEFMNAIREGRPPLASGDDGLQTMRVIAALYNSAGTGRVVPLEV
jgi:predicted dehydrogenase